MDPKYRFKIVHDSDAADFGSVRVTLFSSELHVCGWYISPAGAAPISDGYVPKSANLIASSAVLRAVGVAAQLGVDVCIIDPENLWAEAWGNRDPSAGT